jgi:hypothetical protein
VTSSAFSIDFSSRRETPMFETPINYGDARKSKVKWYCTVEVSESDYTPNIGPDPHATQFHILSNFRRPDDPDKNKYTVNLKPLTPGANGYVAIGVTGTYELYNAAGKKEYWGIENVRLIWEYRFEDRGDYVVDDEHLIIRDAYEDGPMYTVGNAVAMTSSIGKIDKTRDGNAVYVAVSLSLPTKGSYREDGQSVGMQLGIGGKSVEGGVGYDRSVTRGKTVNMPPASQRVGMLYVPVRVVPRTFPPPPLPDALYGLATYDVLDFQENKSKAATISDQITQWKDSLLRFEARHPELPKVTEGLRKGKITVYVTGSASATGSQTSGGRQHNTDLATRRAASVTQYLQSILGVPISKVSPAGPGYQGPPVTVDKKGRIVPNANHRSVEVSLDTDELEKYMRGQTK